MPDMTANKKHHAVATRIGKPGVLHERGQHHGDCETEYAKDRQLVARFGPPAVASQAIGDHGQGCDGPDAQQPAETEHVDVVHAARNGEQRLIHDSL